MTPDSASLIVMAGLDPATQWTRVCAAERLNAATFIDRRAPPARTDVRALGGRVKPGHDELSVGTSRPFVRLEG